jgi:hypothetical protein
MTSRRHVFTSERPFPAVPDGIFSGISQPDIGQTVPQARGQQAPASATS